MQQRSEEDPCCQRTEFEAVNDWHVTFAAADSLHQWMVNVCELVSVSEMDVFSTSFNFRAIY